MAILAECPQCHFKQKVTNKRCGTVKDGVQVTGCGANLDKLKKAGKVKFWITYRLPGGKQRKECVGTSIEDARTADGKRRVQKKENRIFDILPAAKMSFKDLTKWYLKLDHVKRLSSFKTRVLYLKKFNSVYGDMIVRDFKAADLEALQAKRKAEGCADATVDQETAYVRNMVYKAFDNDMVGGDTLKAFKTVKKLLKKNANARDKILTLEQFNALMDHLPHHAKAVLAVAFYTGMRRGEILSLTWDKVDTEKWTIQLEAEDTKDKEPRTVPICDELQLVLRSIPKAIHDNHVFLFRGKPIRDIRTSLEAACKKAGIPYGRFAKDGFVFHDLRHTFNTFMRRAGVPESVIMDITGHSTREMFDRYNTVDHDDKKEAIGRLQRFLRRRENVAQVAPGKE